MNNGVAQKLLGFLDEHVSRDTGNMIFVVGSSECGKSTLTCEVLLRILTRSNGFITTFMSPNYDSIPLQRLILETKVDDSNDVHWEPEEQTKTYRSKKEKKEKRKGHLPIKADRPVAKVGVSEKVPGGGAGAGAGAGGGGAAVTLPNFKISDIYKSDEWIFLKRGWDPTYAWFLYHLRLLLNQRYNESGEVRKFRFAMVLDDEIDLKIGLLRKICLTWRNRNITFVQNCQDITNMDMACRNSVQMFFFGFSNFPARREKIVREYVAPFMQGANIQEKMETFLQLTLNKCFVFVNNRKREAYHINTLTGDVRQLQELQGLQQEISGGGGAGGGGSSQQQQQSSQQQSSQQQPPQQLKKRKRAASAAGAGGAGGIERKKEEEKDNGDGSLGGGEAALSRKDRDVRRASVAAGGHPMSFSSTVERQQKNLLSAVRVEVDPRDTGEHGELLRLLEKKRRRKNPQAFPSYVPMFL